MNSDNSDNFQNILWVLLSPAGAKGYSRIGGADGDLHRIPETPIQYGQKGRSWSSLHHHTNMAGDMAGA